MFKAKVTFLDPLGVNMKIEYLSDKPYGIPEEVLGLNRKIVEMIEDFCSKYDTKVDFKLE
jgi:hypothetical protein